MARVSHVPFSTRSHSTRRRYFVLALLGCCLTAAAFAQKLPRYRYVFTSFDVPGGTGPYGNCINNGGAIVGYFAGSTGSNHGFL
jgi:hypothetical protein